MKFFKKGTLILIAGIMLLSCTACSELDKLADGLNIEGICPVPHFAVTLL